MILALTATGLIGTGGYVFAPAALASASKTPSCSTASLSMVKSALGGSPSGPKEQAGLCNYGTVSIGYVPETLNAVKATVSVNKGTDVTGVGTFAFTFKATKPAATVLAVYASGYEIIVKSAKATLAQEETLARKILPLV